MFGSATLAPDPAVPDQYLLILSGLDEAALAVPDHPARQAATVSTAYVVGAVASEAGDPPIATLVAPLAGGEPAAAVVELLSAAHDAAADTVTYRVAVLGEDADQMRPAATPLAAPTGEQRFGLGYLGVDTGPIGP